MATVKTYTSITLTPGQAVVIPSGSNLVYTSSVGSTSSVCADIPEVPTQCYVFQVPMSGTDVDGIIEDTYVVGFYLDTLFTSILGNYGGGYGTSTASTDYESPQGFTDRLANNIWNQLTALPNNVIVGLIVNYNDSDGSGGDVVQIHISVPDIFTNVTMKLSDANNTNNTPTFLLQGVEETCGSYYPDPEGLSAKGDI